MVEFWCALCDRLLGRNSSNAHLHMEKEHDNLESCVLHTDTGRIKHRQHRVVPSDDDSEAEDEGEDDTSTGEESDAGDSVYSGSSDASSHTTSSTDPSPRLPSPDFTAHAATPAIVLASVDPRRQQGQVYGQEQQQHSSMTFSSQPIAPRLSGEMPSLARQGGFGPPHGWTSPSYNSQPHTAPDTGEEKEGNSIYGPGHRFRTRGHDALHPYEPGIPRHADDVVGAGYLRLPQFHPFSTPVPPRESVISAAGDGGAESRHGQSYGENRTPAASMHYGHVDGGHMHPQLQPHDSSPYFPEGVVSSAADGFGADMKSEADDNYNISAVGGATFEPVDDRHQVGLRVRDTQQHGWLPDASFEQIFLTISPAPLQQSLHRGQQLRLQQPLLSSDDSDDSVDASRSPSSGRKRKDSPTIDTSLPSSPVSRARRESADSVSSTNSASFWSDLSDFDLSQSDTDHGDGPRIGSLTLESDTDTADDRLPHTPPIDRIPPESDTDDEDQPDTDDSSVDVWRAMF